MDLVVDTSVIIAVLLNESNKANIVEAASGCALIGPPVIAWETGNALSAMFKRKRINLSTALKAMRAYEDIPIRYIAVNFIQSLKLAYDHNLYAYDAYFLDCARRHNAPLLSLDVALVETARQIGIEVKEIPQ